MVRLWVAAALGAVFLGTAAYAATPVYGDADGNSALTVNDVKVLAKIAGGLTASGADSIRYSDVAPVVNNDAGQFGDGRITILDVLRVAQQVANPAKPDFPAKPTAYPLQPGNTFTVRKYDSTGTATGDVTSVVGEPAQQVLSDGTYVVNPLTSPDGTQKLTSQKIVNGVAVPFTDSLGRPALGAIQLSFGGSTDTFDPPLVVMVYPFSAGTTWAGTTNTTISGVGVVANYTGTVGAMEALDVPAGHFDNAWKVTLAYNGNAGFASAVGEEYYWFVPFLGPIQHGYTRTITVFGSPSTKTVNPDLKLVSATVHGASFP
jgi:hypothetical protein